MADSEEVHITITRLVPPVETVDLAVVLLVIVLEVLWVVELVQRGKETMEVEAEVNIIPAVVAVLAAQGLIQQVNQTVALEYKILSWEFPTFGAVEVEVHHILYLPVVMVVMVEVVAERLELLRAALD